MCFIKHNWGKWEQYNIGIKETFLWEDERDGEWGIQIREKRFCKDCRKMQDRRIR